MGDTTSDTDPPEVASKLHAARARLVIDKPFIGALLLHLPLEPGSWCESVATDARKLYFNPRYIGRLSLRQTQFVLAHEAMHCALGHFARRQHRVRRRWDIACDHAVNLLLLEEGLEPMPDVLADVRFRGLSAEEIYPLLAEDSVAATLDTHLFDYSTRAVGAIGAGSATEKGEGSTTPAEGEPAAGSDDDTWSDAVSHARRNPPGALDAPSVPPLPQELAQRWQMRVALAAQQARHAGRLSGSWQRLLGGSIEPVLPWRALLARFVLSRAQDDFSFQRPSRRESAALLPRLHSRQIDLHVVLDTSGSVSETELSAFTAELDALKGQARARVTVHACDHQLSAQGPWVFQPWQPITLPQHLAGGGATDFTPVFEWTRTEGLRPDLLLYFTDAEGDFPPSPPPYPVIWLVKGRASVPWGERIQLN